MPSEVLRFGLGRQNTIDANAECYCTFKLGNPTEIADYSSHLADNLVLLDPYAKVDEKWLKSCPVGPGSQIDVLSEYRLQCGVFMARAHSIKNRLRSLAKAMRDAVSAALQVIGWMIGLRPLSAGLQLWTFQRHEVRS